MFEADPGSVVTALLALSQNLVAKADVLVSVTGPGHTETNFGGAAKAALPLPQVERPLRRKPRFPRRRFFESGTSAFADNFLPFLTNNNLQNVAVLDTSLLTARQTFLRNYIPVLVTISTPCF